MPVCLSTCDHRSRLAGLTATYLLGKMGYSVTVIEKDPVDVGRISRIIEHDGV